MFLNDGKTQKRFSRAVASQPYLEKLIDMVTQASPALHISISKRIYFSQNICVAQWKMEDLSQTLVSVRNWGENAHSYMELRLIQMNSKNSLKYTLGQKFNFDTKSVPDFQNPNFPDLWVFFQYLGNCQA